MNLANLPSKSIEQATMEAEGKIDEVIDRVLQGGVTIRLIGSPKSSTPSPSPPTLQHRVPLSSQIILEPIEVLATPKQSASSFDPKPVLIIENSNPSASNESDSIQLNIVKIHSDSNESTKQQPLSPTDIPKKHALSNETTSPKAERPSKLKKKNDPVTPTYNISNDDMRLTRASSTTAMVLTDIAIPSSSSSETVIIMPMDHSDRESARDSMEVPDIDRTDDVVNNQNSSTNEQPLVIHPSDQPHGIDSDDLFSLEIKNEFSSSTPSPSLSSLSETTSSSTTNQVIPTVSKERSSSLLVPCKTVNTYIYDFFIPNLSSSLSSRDENPSHSLLTTSSTAEHHHSSNQQSCPLMDTYFLNNSQSQVRLFSDVKTY